MIEKKVMIPFLDKEIGLVYEDSGKDFYARGILRDITDASIKLETNFNIVLISLNAIKKIKISKTEL
jgi:hypothetical protein